MNHLPPGVEDFASQLAQDLPPPDVGHILRVFRADIDRLCRAAEQAALAGDGPGFHRLAHSMAGAAGAVGATTLERAARAAMVPKGGAIVDLAAVLSRETQGALACAARYLDGSGAPFPVPDTGR